MDNIRGGAKFTSLHKVAWAPRSDPEQTHSRPHTDTADTNIKQTPSRHKEDPMSTFGVCFDVRLMCLVDTNEGVMKFKILKDSFMVFLSIHSKFLFR